MSRFVPALLVLLTLLLVVSGCVAPAAAPAATPDADATSVVAVNACGEGLRAVDHAMGQTCVPQEPQRVVVLDTGELDSVLALGVKPVGAVSAFATGELPSYLGERTAGIEVVGTIAEPNLEAILALEPDLILSSKRRHEALYDELSAIAPTVFAEAVGVVWKENFLLNAEALNRRAEAEAMLAEYRGRLEELRASLGDTPPTISMVRFVPGEVRIYLKASFIGTILEDAGLPRPPAQDVDDFALFVGKEGIPQMDGDVIFVTTYGPAEETDYASFINDPLFQSLPAVQNGQMYEVPDAYWMLGIGILAANMVVDDLYTYLVGEVPAPAAADTSAENALDSGTRTITHALGTSEVPADPQRVVVLDTGELDNALALGANLVGAPITEAQKYQPYLVDQLAGLADTGAVSEPNLEAILAMQPDLIVGSVQRHEAIYDELSAIAPTVFVGSLRVPWQENFAIHADALNRQAEAEALLAEYDTRIAELQATLGEDLPTISVVRFRPGMVRIYLKNSFSGYILQDVGLPRPAAQDVADFAAEISLEQLNQLDADVMFYTSFTPEENDFTTFSSSPLWQTLDVVQQGRVYEVDDAHWMSGLGVQAANLILDDLFTYLVE